MDPGEQGATDGLSINALEGYHLTGRRDQEGAKSYGLDEDPGRSSCPWQQI